MVAFVGLICHVKMFNSPSTLEHGDNILYFLMETCNLSLEVDFMSEIEGQSDNNRLKIHVHHDRKLPTCLYKELEEERSASVDAYIDVSVYFYQCFLYASGS
ncbi:hypothetical protein Bca4012_073224 [Brassica carinata]|uniref:(rape) hypothetical protein n=1 Tax=Brassica napus TaxID=3708 RepID=A0A816L4P4_BRANA|nr:unnamed protein product [Brassica napus]